jgi:hypothetical protein
VEIAVAGVENLAVFGVGHGEKAIAVDHQVERRAGVLDAADREVLVDRLGQRADADLRLGVGEGAARDDVEKLTVLFLKPVVSALARLFEMVFSSVCALRMPVSEV